MKLILALAVSIALALATSSTLFTEETAAQKAADEAAPESLPEPEAFSLDKAEEDEPDMARFKASLRLLNSYTVTATQLKACAAGGGSPEFSKILSGYLSRNGTTMNQVMQAVKQYGGITSAIKEAMDARAAALIADDPRSGDCQKLMEEVKAGKEDIYKADKYVDDYRLLRQKNK